MNHTYHIIDSLKVCVTDTHMFMYMPTQSSKVCKISDNKDVFDILKCYPKITQEEFEKDMPSRNSSESLIKTIYFSTFI